jgi:hypothetical protein
VSFARIETKPATESATPLELIFATGERLFGKWGRRRSSAADRVCSPRMIHLPASVRVYVCLTPCDMRRSFDGLHALVRDHLELDPFTGHLYLFASRRPDRLKLLLLGPRRFRALGEASGRRRLCDSLCRATLARGISGRR